MLLTAYQRLDAQVLDASGATPTIAARQVHTRPRRPQTAELETSEGAAPYACSPEGRHVVSVWRHVKRGFEWVDGASPIAISTTSSP